MATKPTFEQLSNEKVLRLTTFRRDGTPVATPVWLVPEGPYLLVITGSGTGKAKRIRHTPKVLLVPCSQRGKVAEGLVDVEAVAEIDESPEAVARQVAAVKSRYGLMGRVAMFFNERAARKSGQRIVIRLRGAAQP